MTNIHIRPATTADLPTLYRFEQGIISTERPFDPTLKPDPIHYYDLSAMIAAPDVHLLVAEIQGQPGTRQQTSTGQLVGSGYARIEPAKPYLRHPVHAYLGFMYVDPAHRGKGINTLIIEGLRGWAQSRGITELRLDVYNINTSAIRAYEKAGFVPHMLNMRSPV